ncbi:MAG TPA: MFS transporter [Steroidobacteraceae bacterium]|jgi:MFS family permease
MKPWRATRVVMGLLCFMYFMTYLDRVNVSSAAAGFGKEFGLSSTQIGLVFSAFAYPYLVFQIIGGWLSDRYGARRTLIVCALVWSAATVLTGMSVGLLSMLGARLLLGLGEGATLPAASTAMSRWVSRGRRGYAQGITHAAARVGNAVAPAVVVAIMATHGWRASFYVCAAFSFLWVVVWALSFTEFPKDHPRITPAELADLSAGGPAASASASPARTASQAPSASAPANAPIPWRGLVKRMAPVTIVYFCYGWTLWLFLSWLPQYFLHSHGLDLKQSALFSSSVFFAGVIGDTLGGIVTDRVLRRTASLRIARSRMVALCMAASLVSLLPTLFFHSTGVALVCLSLGFFFAEMTIGPMWAVPMDIAPEHAGTACGMMNTGSALAAIVSPVASGFLIDRFGNWELPFIASMALMGAGVILSGFMRPDARFEDLTPPAAVPA